MKKIPVEAAKRFLEKGFQWRARTGEMFSPCDMETRHLFFTVLMIWNHSCPPEQRIWKTQKYYFTEFYTPKYMLTALVNLLVELSIRGDIDKRFEQALDKMWAHLFANNLKKEFICQ